MAVPLCGHHVVSDRLSAVDGLIAQIATTGNLAVLVLMVVCGGLFKMLREERALEREARKEDATRYAEASDRQTSATVELAKALNEFRLDVVKNRRDS